MIAAQIPDCVRDPHPRYFPEHPKQLDLPGRLKLTLAEYVVIWEQDGETWRLRIPPDFLHDGASVPRFVWSVYPPHALDRAAVTHDYAYHYAGKLPPRKLCRKSPDGWEQAEQISRKWWDRAFRVHLDMDPEGPSRWRRRAAYRAVRAFGRSHYG